MNDPEIIRKLEEIKEELSGIKYEVNWAPKFFLAVVFITVFGGAMGVVVMEWLF